ncbi:MAG TPA: hypothetical protein EYQ20_04915 [candidate division Zixibacteria bacterium]|nr:hypothetical protein [candidate division Zixibacteria bacterium]
MSFIVTDHYEGSRKSGERIADLIEARRQAEPSFNAGIILRRYDPGPLLNRRAAGGQMGKWVPYYLPG